MHASHDIDHQAADHHRCRALLITVATVVRQFHILFRMAVIATARTMTRSLSTIGAATNSPEGSGAFRRACDELFMPVRQNKSAQTISGQNGRKCAAGAPMGLRLCTLPRGGWQQQGLYYVHDPKQPASSGLL
jgi:hypothetical protein